MSEIIQQLQTLFLQTIPTVAFVFLLYVTLDRLLFRPLTKVLKEREDVTIGAMVRAREQIAAAEAKSQQYEAALQGARQEIFRLREAARGEANAERERMLKEARAESESRLRKALATLAAEVETAKHELRKSTEALALEIAETVLGGGPSADKKGRVAS